MSITFGDIVFAPRYREYSCPKSMIIVHSYQLDYKPDTENSFM